jgi:hypothetical protein
MERIEGGGFFAYRREAREKKESSRSRKGGGVGFLRALEQRVNEAGGAEQGAAVNGHSLSSVEEAEQFLDEIHQLGERLAKQRTFTALKEYRQAVQTFMNTVVSDGLDMQAHTSGSNILNRKRYSMIQVINEKLQRLASGMLQTQRPQLELLRRVEEIHGMLVNLLQ